MKSVKWKVGIFSLSLNFHFRFAGIFSLSLNFHFRFMVIRTNEMKWNEWNHKNEKSNQKSRAKFANSLPCPQEFTTRKVFTLTAQIRYLTKKFYGDKIRTFVNRTCNEKAMTSFLGVNSVEIYCVIKFLTIAYRKHISRHVRINPNIAW